MQLSYFIQFQLFPLPVWLPIDKKDKWTQFRWLAILSVLVNFVQNDKFSSQAWNAYTDFKRFCRNCTSKLYCFSQLFLVLCLIWHRKKKLCDRCKILVIKCDFHKTGISWRSNLCLERLRIVFKRTQNTGFNGRSSQ